MLTGKHFRLKKQALAIEGASDKRTATFVPAGETVRVLSGPRPDDRRMVDVLWGNKVLVMFVEDLEIFGEMVPT